MTQVWVDGQPDNSVNPLDRGLAYGDGLFATMRVHQGEIQFLNTHFERLTQGAYRLGFQWQPSSDLKQQLSALAKTNPNACIKIVLTRGVGGRGYGAAVVRHNPAIILDNESIQQINDKPVSSSQVSTPLNTTEIVSVHPLPTYYKQWQQQGVSLALADIRLGRQPKLAGIKHCNRLEQVLIKSVELAEGNQDWLVLDSDNNVIESSMANIFFVVDKIIITPRISFAGVAGMMREQVIHQLLQMGYSVQITDFHHSMLADAKHVFITNSLFGLVDVVAIADRRFSRASWTSRIREHLCLTL
ncbi:aminodeoxychorismate lyase [Shewanella schlegeliana]|uniref:Aminodeoxychorismate lyase n=1 Tax=Shewanella schlegeliana TaxID=190308 RepID=A0ABS1SZH3_9GAMM|nr:aminodeoxychorismate lyase [Shewanella schlegeliana]MBL4913735.1 aminodeoxychorismate lyase [Shewanella schlegeliana]MCL1111548.1 aminodeoxychorismate lyase [Shewanella schlegeliana]GIU36713.1 4-amino-4-deoxychorismate lyase [Shewanella schlegeliana]